MLWLADGLHWTGLISSLIVPATRSQNPPSSRRTSAHLLNPPQSIDSGDALQLGQASRPKGTGEYM